MALKQLIETMVPTEKIEVRNIQSIDTIFKGRVIRLPNELENYNVITSVLYTDEWKDPYIRVLVAKESEY